MVLHVLIVNRSRADKKLNSDFIYYFVLLFLGLSQAGYSEQIHNALHKLCLDAKDYQGCVNSRIGQEPKQLRVITQEGAAIAEGNACPANMAYAGGGYCRSVICHDPGVFDNGHEPPLGGKNWSCAGFNTGLMKWGDTTSRAFQDPSCPNVALQPGWMNTCYQAGEIKGTIRPGGTGRYQ